jgi:hypothetical protein
MAELWPSVPGEIVAGARLPKVGSVYDMAKVQAALFYRALSAGNPQAGSVRALVAPSRWAM